MSVRVLTLVVLLLSALQKQVTAGPHDCTIQITGLSQNEPGASAMGYYMESGWINRRPTYVLNVPEYMVLPNHKQNRGSQLLWYSNNFRMWIVSTLVHSQPFLLATKSAAPIASQIKSVWANYYEGHFNSVSRIKIMCAGATQPPSQTPSTAPTAGLGRALTKQVSRGQRAYAEIMKIEEIEEDNREHTGIVSTMVPHLQGADFMHALDDVSSRGHQIKGKQISSKVMSEVSSISKRAAIAAAKAAQSAKHAGGSAKAVAKAAGVAARNVVLAHGGSPTEASIAATAALNAVGFASPALLTHQRGD